MFLISSSITHRVRASYCSELLIYIKIIAALLLSASFGIVSAETHISVDDSIAGMATNSNGRTLTWYKDGTYTIGGARDLDYDQTPKTYKVGSGHSTGDIVGIAMSKYDDVYTWYQDNTVTIGKPYDLSVTTGPIPYLKPKKKRGVFIIDMTMDGHNVVRTYFTDGTLSKGIMTNLSSKGSNINYQVPASVQTRDILGIAQNKYQNKSYTWYRTGYAGAGTDVNLGVEETIFKQHITLYSNTLNEDLVYLSPNPSGLITISNSNQSYTLVRDGLNTVHEQIIAPGKTEVAIASNHLSVYKKDNGDRIMELHPTDLFKNYLAGSNDEVLELNSHTFVQSCANGHPQTQFGNFFCMDEAYDSRVAYDKVGDRFVYLVNMRNQLGRGYPDGAPAPEAPDGECTRYEVAPKTPKFINSYCGMARRHLGIAISMTSNPAEGFHLYAITESNYRDWPSLAVQGDQLIVGHASGEKGHQPDGFTALVFSLEDMRSGSKRPKYYRIDNNNSGIASRLLFPRDQDSNNARTVAVGIDGNLYSHINAHVSYDFNPIHKTDASLAFRVSWTFQDNILTRSYLASAGDIFTINDAKKLGIEEFKVPVNSLGIPLSPTPSLDEFWPMGEYSSLSCSRLAITKSGIKIASFNGARLVAEENRLEYDAAFTVDKTHLGLPIESNTPSSARRGDYTDVNSGLMNENLSVSKALCQQQGAAAADPYLPDTVWAVQNYGSQSKNKTVIRGALYKVKAIP